MQVDAYSKARLVDCEEMAQPGAEEPNDRRIGVRELHGAIALRSFSHVQRHSCNQELRLGQCSNAGRSFAVELLDLAELRFVRRVGAPVRSPQLERRRERDVPRQIDTDDFETPSVSAMSARGPDYIERVFVRQRDVYQPEEPRYNLDMRFRVGLVAGLAIGYYLGTKAGRERYEQIRRWIDDARQSQPVEKAQAAVELGLERVRQKNESVTGASPNGPGAAS